MLLWYYNTSIWAAVNCLAEEKAAKGREGCSGGGGQSLGGRRLSAELRGGVPGHFMQELPGPSQCEEDAGKDAGAPSGPSPRQWPEFHTSLQMEGGSSWGGASLGPRLWHCALAGRGVSALRSRSRWLRWGGKPGAGRSGYGGGRLSKTVVPWVPWVPWVLVFAQRAAPAPGKAGRSASASCQNPIRRRRACRRRAGPWSGGRGGCPWRSPR